MPATPTPQTENTGGFYDEPAGTGAPYLNLDREAEQGERTFRFDGEPRKVSKDFGRGPQETWEVPIRDMVGDEYLLTLSSKRLRDAVRAAFPGQRIAGKSVQMSWTGKNQQRKYAVKALSLTTTQTLPPA